MVNRLLFVFYLFCSVSVFGQYSFTGNISDSVGGKTVYLSLIEDYRKISRTYLEQILKKTVTDSTGYFKFNGDNLLDENRIYKIHVDECTEESNGQHFFGNCQSTKSILFIAKAKDTIYFPSTFNDEIFCDLNSTNPSSIHLLRIDELLDNMAYDYASFNSDANKRLTSQKWFDKLQEFGKSLHEPLAELYIYQFLSDSRNETFDYFIKDLLDNDYYHDLKQRLNERYLSASFTNQYQAEIESFLAFHEKNRKSSEIWTVLLSLLLLLSLLMNVYLWYAQKRFRSKYKKELASVLSKQEQKVLHHIQLGLSNKEIASTLFISVSTVKSHINNIYKKLNVASRNQLKGF